jgi:hypothetical protein
MRFDRDRILAAVDLPALADELLGPHRGPSRSAMWPCPSPQHAQTGRTPPVSIFRTSGGEQRWHCHGCGIGGSAVDLVMAARGVPVRDALEELAARTGSRDWALTDTPNKLRSQQPRATPAPAACGDLRGLGDYVQACAERLWQPAGGPVLRWLTRARGLPEEVLRANRIGADPGRHDQPRPDGMPAAGWAAVLPVFEEGRAVFAHLRSLHPPPGRPRYLNAATRLAPNPRVAVYAPAQPVGPCVVVTEGAVDALSANAAGFRAAAVLGAALAGLGADAADQSPVVDRLAHQGAPLLVAFDADAAGDHAGKRLHEMLRARGIRAGRLRIPDAANDLNGWMCRTPDWEHTFRMAVRVAMGASRDPRRVATR